MNRKTNFYSIFIKKLITILLFQSFNWIIKIEKKYLKIIFNVYKGGIV